MASVAVLGLAGSSAARVAEKLERILPAEHEVAAAANTEEVDPDAALLVFIDDAPRGKDEQGEARSALLAQVAEARTAGKAIAILCDRKAADRWIEDVKYQGLPEPAGPLRRVFVASGHSPESQSRVTRLAEALGLPVVEPDRNGEVLEGWGPRYAAIAREELWLVHTPSWHAVEVFSEQADIVIYSEIAPREAPRELPAPAPEAKKWRVMFGPWFKRYPRVEAGLLSREVSHHEHEVPVFRIRTAEEAETVLAGFLAGARRPV